MSSLVLALALVPAQPGYGQPVINYPAQGPIITQPGFSQPGIIYPQPTYPAQGPIITQPGVMYPQPTYPQVTERPQPPQNMGGLPDTPGGGHIVQRAIPVGNGRIKYQKVRVLPNGQTIVLSETISGGNSSRPQMNRPTGYRPSPNYVPQRQGYYPGQRTFP